MENTTPERDDNTTQPEHPSPTPQDGATHTDADTLNTSDTGADTTHENTNTEDASHTDGTPDGIDGIDDPLADSELARALTRITELEDQLARTKADYYNLNTEYGNYVRRAKEAVPGYKNAGHVDVLEALIGVLDDIDAARKAGDLDGGPFAAIATKLEETLTGKFGLSRYGAEGDDFDPTLHEALMARPNPDVEHDVIGQVLQPGYMMGERILRVAKVLVDNPA